MEIVERRGSVDRVESPGHCTLIDGNGFAYLRNLVEAAEACARNRFKSIHNLPVSLNSRHGRIPLSQTGPERNFHAIGDGIVSPAPAFWILALRAIAGCHLLAAKELPAEMLGARRPLVSLTLPRFSKGPAIG
jgi:hypothetical protein